MIDPCIYKVYKENQQVFIPEFGAIIHSEVSDSPSFNEMLNFDDGKVIEAIMEKQNISEEEAKTALQEHVQMIKAKLDESKTHYIRGLGHIYKDEQGAMAISKKKPSLNFTSNNENPTEEMETQNTDNSEFEDIYSSFEASEEQKLEDTTSEEFSSTDAVEENTDYSSFMSSIDDDAENKTDDTTGENENPFEMSTESGENQFEFSSEFGSNEDNQESEDSWQDGNEEYSYDEENYEGSDPFQKESFYEEEGKGNRLLKTLTAAVVVLFIVSAVGYYFLFYEGDDKQANKDASYKTELASAKKDPSKEKKEATASNKANVTSSAASEQKSASASPAVSAGQYADGEGPFYSVILGSFKVENNANNFQKYLQDRGMEVAIFRRDNDFHFVGFEEIPGKSNAIGLLTEMREEEPTAWIIRKKGQ